MAAPPLGFQHECQSAQLCPTPVTLWTIPHQAPLSTGLPRQEYWSGLPFPPQGDLLNPGIKLGSPALAGGFFTTQPPGKPLVVYGQVQVPEIIFCLDASFLSFPSVQYYISDSMIESSFKKSCLFLTKQFYVGQVGKMRCFI